MNSIFSNLSRNSQDGCLISALSLDLLSKRISMGKGKESSRVKGNAQVQHRSTLAHFLPSYNQAALAGI